MGCEFEGKCEAAEDIAAPGEPFCDRCHSCNAEDAVSSGRPLGTSDFLKGTFDKMPGAFVSEAGVFHSADMEPFDPADMAAMKPEDDGFVDEDDEDAVADIEGEDDDNRGDGYDDLVAVPAVLDGAWSDVSAVDNLDPEDADSDYKYVDEVVLPDGVGSVSSETDLTNDLLGDPRMMDLRVPYTGRILAAIEGVEETDDVGAVVDNGGYDGALRQREDSPRFGDGEYGVFSQSDRGV